MWTHIGFCLVLGVIIQLSFMAKCELTRWTNASVACFPWTTLCVDHTLVKNVMKKTLKKRKIIDASNSCKLGINLSIVVVDGRLVYGLFSGIHQLYFYIFGRHNYRFSLFFITIIY